MQCLRRNAGRFRLSSKLVHQVLIGLGNQKFLNYRISDSKKCDLNMLFVFGLKDNNSM